MPKLKMVPFLLKCTVFMTLIGTPLNNQAIAEEATWDHVFESFLFPERNNEPPESQPGGSRGTEDMICSLAPLDQETYLKLENQVWNNRPIFVWTGKVERIELYAETSGNLIWKQTVTPEKNQISYTGEPLKSGESYKLYLYDVSDPEPSYPPSVALDFKVVEAEKSQQITQALNQLETQLQQNKATPEAIALARAEYFAKQQLWSDVVMESVLVKSPPSGLTELLETKIPELVCS